MALADIFGLVLFLAFAGGAAYFIITRRNKKNQRFEAPLSAKDRYNSRTPEQRGAPGRGAGRPDDTETP